MVGKQERIDALELLGATFVDKKRDMLGALTLWKRAMEERWRKQIIKARLIQSSITANQVVHTLTQKSSSILPIIRFKLKIYKWASKKYKYKFQNGRGFSAWLWRIRVSKKYFCILKKETEQTIARSSYPALRSLLTKICSPPTSS